MKTKETKLNFLHIVQFATQCSMNIVKDAGTQKFLGMPVYLITLGGEVFGVYYHNPDKDKRLVRFDFGKLHAGINNALDLQNLADKLSKN